MLDETPVDKATSVWVKLCGITAQGGMELVQVGSSFLMIEFTSGAVNGGATIPDTGTLIVEVMPAICEASCAAGVETVGVGSLLQ